MKLIYTFIIYSFFIVLTAYSYSGFKSKGFIYHYNICNASAAVAIDSSFFIAANDEDNILRIYRNNMDGAPINSYNLNSFLGADKKRPEADIEGATKIGDRIFWITSHGRNKNGKIRSSRYRFFATDIKRDKGNITIEPAGIPYKNLLEGLVSASQLEKYKLNAASKEPPKDYGALNIEGLCATSDDKLLIGFRNPIPDGKALIVPLENPQEVIRDKAAVFGTPIKLSLEGYGIRSIEYFPIKKKYIIIGGSYNGSGISKLFEWSGIPSEDPKLINKVNFSDLNPEAIIIYNSGKNEIQILSDDGSSNVKGKICENAKMEERKFRSEWFSL